MREENYMKSDLKEWVLDSNNGNERGLDKHFASAITNKSMRMIRNIPG